MTYYKINISLYYIVIHCNTKKMANRFPKQMIFRATEESFKKFEHIMRIDDKTTWAELRNIFNIYINDWEKKNWKINVNQLNLLNK